jgi:hypothetical protein
MWLMTQYGFFSIVQHKDDSEKFLVRARVRLDLDRLKDLAALTTDIVEIKSADYRYRIEISREEMLRVLRWLGEAINYPNFKDRIADLPDQKDRLAQYHEIWGTMRKIKESPSSEVCSSLLRPSRYGLEIHEIAKSGEKASAEPPVITKKGMNALLKYLPIFSQKDYEAGTCDVEEGSQYPWSYNEDVSQFMQDCYTHGFILDVNWPKWQDEALRLCTSGDIMNSDILTLQLVLTTILRKDRFCDGTVAIAIKDGFIVQILKRLKQLRNVRNR